MTGIMIGSVLMHMPTVQAQVSQDYLLVFGQIDADDQATLKPLRIREFPVGTSDDVGEGSAQLRVYFKSQLIFERRFEPVRYADTSAEAPLYFGETMPVTLPLTHVELFYNNELVTMVELSLNAPTVTLASPTGGETLSGQYTIRWRGIDLDDDPLSYDLYYSHDAGLTWEVLAIALDQEEFDWDTTSVAGGDQSLVRVVVSDGFATAQDQDGYDDYGRGQAAAYFPA